MKWYDGIVSLYNSIANARNSTLNNKITSSRIAFTELNHIYKNGLGNKIARIKSSYAAKYEAINFDNDDDATFYKSKIKTYVEEAFLWAIVFGRGIVVINDGSDLSTPLLSMPQSSSLEVFSGDMVSVTSYSTDLNSTRYLKPIFYSVNGYNIHHSRVIDFTYVKVTERDRPSYNFGGISEFELIYNQIVNDGIVERSSISMLEKNSSLFYKIKGFKQALANKQEDNIVKFFTMAENKRSIYGAGLIDKDDDVVSVSQTLTNLKDADDISLRRIAMVSGIPLPMLVGENVKGMNSSGQQEKTIFNEMIESLQQLYLFDNINTLMKKLGRRPITFKEHQNITANEKIDYESKVIDNAIKLYDLGYDVEEYLSNKGIEAKIKDEFETEFQSED